jgi:hypothetical protein
MNRAFRNQPVFAERRVGFKAYLSHSWTEGQRRINQSRLQTERTGTDFALGSRDKVRETERAR